MKIIRFYKIFFFVCKWNKVAKYETYDTLHPETANRSMESKMC